MQFDFYGRESVRESSAKNLAKNIVLRLEPVLGCSTLQEEQKSEDDANDVPRLKCASIIA